MTVKITDEMVEKAFHRYREKRQLIGMSVDIRDGIHAALEAVADDIVAASMREKLRDGRPVGYSGTPNTGSAEHHAGISMDDVTPEQQAKLSEFAELLSKDPRDPNARIDALVEAVDCVLRFDADRPYSVKVAAFKSLDRAR